MLLLHRQPKVGRLIAERNFAGLVKALGYQDGSHVRAAAAKGLGDLGDPRAVEPLIAMLGDTDWNVRKAVIAALGRLGDPGAVVPMMSLFLSDDASFGDAALSALVMIGAPAVDALVAALKGDAYSVRREAAEALGRISDPQAVEGLIGALGDPKAAVRGAAAGALDQIGWTPDRGPAGAAYWVAKRRWDKCRKKAAVEALIVVLDDEDDSVRSSASRLLTKIGVPAIGPLIDSLDPAAGAVLVKIGPPAVEPLIVALTDQDCDVRMRAAQLLGDIGDARAVEPLFQLLQDQEADLVDREAAAEALGRIGDSRSIQCLDAALRDDRKLVRRAAAQALHASGVKPDDAVQPMHYEPMHYEWVDESKKYNREQHVIQFACSTCGGLLTVLAVLMFDDELVCEICGKPTTVPSVPCVVNWCSGVYEVCGGEIEAIDTSSYACGPDTDYRCTSCGMLHNGIRNYRGDERCDAVRCSKCGELVWSTAHLQPLGPSVLHWAGHQP